MAGSEQKTQIATEMPPEVASALANQASPGGAGGPPAAAPPAAGPPPAAAAAGAGARTMIASAPALPGAPPPTSPPGADAAGARTMLATAPAVPALGGQATLIAGPGGAPPGAPAAPINAAATLYNANSGPSSSPGGRTAPLPLRPASAVFGAAPTGGNVLVTGKWVIGPVVALVLMLITAAIANRIWPPATGSGGGGPSFLAAKRAIQIVSEPPGAEVQVDGLVLDEKTPTQVKGEIGKNARIRVSLPGYDPHEVTLAFTQDARPPYKVKLFKAGTRQKSLDPSVFDEKPDVSKNDEDADDKKPTGDKGKDDGKKPAGDKDEKSDKTDKTDKKDEKTDKKGDKKKDESEDEEDGKKKGKKTKDGDSAKKAKATLTVLVRPWAIVYLDGKKLQQTPLRNHPISAGAHKVLLVNDTKGKREEIKLKVTAGEAVPEIKRTWE